MNTNALTTIKEIEELIKTSEKESHEMMTLLLNHRQEIEALLTSEKEKNTKGQSFPQD
ncbi:MAG: hypothetical protein ACRC2N_09420 [Aeromonas sp.]